MSSRTSTINVNAGRKDQAQYLAPNIPEIKQINPYFLKTMTIPGYKRNLDVYACRILSQDIWEIMMCMPVEYYLMSEVIFDSWP